MTSRREQKEALRRQRAEREAAAAAAARRKRRLGIVAATVLVVVAVVAVGAVALTGGNSNGSKAESSVYPKESIPAPKSVGLQDAAKAARCVLRNYPDFGNTHTTAKVTYKTNPPTSGNHNPVPADDGVYTTAPPKENTVHTLEHGRIELQYKPGTPAKVRGQLKALFDEDVYHMVLMPNQTGMKYQVAATAWTHLIGCNQVNDNTWDALRAFKTAYRDQAPERVP
ncbi:MAG TPA: DUF3105 domain-containing protein [Thermoleophilaceae bacterium]